MIIFVVCAICVVRGREYFGLGSSLVTCLFFFFVFSVSFLSAFVLGIFSLFSLKSLGFSDCVRGTSG